VFPHGCNYKSEGRDYKYEPEKISRYSDQATGRTNEKLLSPIRDKGFCPPQRP